jgi:signal-transduction protein with cAMP-binding, CBS, and nucleotidyltransferase domain
MSKANQQQDVSILSAAKRGLVYLTPNDWALIADKAARLKFKPGDLLVHQGKRTHGVYLLLKGTASVQIPSMGTHLINPGEACGEISFLDELPATVNVVAKEEVEAYYLDRPTLQSVFELFPHLGSRFYQSLAAILSRRLRELIGPVPEKIASVKSELPKAEAHKADPHKKEHPEKELAKNDAAKVDSAKLDSIKLDSAKIDSAKSTPPRKDPSPKH